MFVGPLDEHYTFGAAFKWVWLYPLLPFAGSIIALFFYEFVFKKARSLTENVGEEEGSEDSD
jgi:hypothetical protein